MDPRRRPESYTDEDEIASEFPLSSRGFGRETRSPARREEESPAQLPPRRDDERFFSFFFICHPRDEARRCDTTSTIRLSPYLTHSRKGETLATDTLALLGFCSWTAQPFTRTQDPWLDTHSISRSLSFTLTRSFYYLTNNSGINCNLNWIILP